MDKPSGPSPTIKKNKPKSTKPRKVMMLPMTWVKASETLDMNDDETVKHYNSVLKYVKDFKDKEKLMEPIEVCRDGPIPWNIIDGHNRFKAASELGWKHIPAVLCDKLSKQLDASKGKRKKKKKTKKKKKKKTRKYKNKSKKI